jgi:hypothetical protein
MTNVPSLYVLHRKSIPKDIRYVGITIHEDVQKRFMGHLDKTKSGVNRPVNDWINKYYPDIQITKISSAITWEEACSQEVALIARLKSEGHKLLNMTLGGDGTVGAKDSEETRKKKSLALTGHKVSQETRDKISKSNTGKKRSIEARKKMSEKKKGIKLSEEHIRKISEAITGKKRTVEQRRNISNSLKGKKFTPEHYASIVEAQRRRRLREKLEKEKKQK